MLQETLCCCIDSAIQEFTIEVGNGEVLCIAITYIENVGSSHGGGGVLLVEMMLLLLMVVQLLL